jgi:hypothetical protein
MKNPWLSAAFLAVALAVSACGGTDETLEPAQVSEPGIVESRDGNVEQKALACDEQGLCPTGYYCDGLGICRRGVVAAALPCDEQGLCPTGYYCDGLGICRRGVALSQ